MWMLLCAFLDNFGLVGPLCITNTGPLYLQTTQPFSIAQLTVDLDYVYTCSGNLHSSSNFYGIYAQTCFSMQGYLACGLGTHLWFILTFVLHGNLIDKCYVIFSWNVRGLGNQVKHSTV